MDAVATTATELLDGLTALAASHLDADDIPGAAIGVSVHGQTAVTGLGVTRRDRPEPVTADTAFRICSITKPFTATLAHLLAARHLVDFDAPVSRYLPELRLVQPGLADTIHIRHLLTHSSGLECELPVDLFSYGSDDGATRRMLDDFHRLRHLADVGAVWGYGNAGYWLLGAVLAAAAGCSYEQAMHRYLLAPLGLRSTTFDTGRALTGPLAHPHDTGAAADQSAPAAGYPRVRRPSGGLIATPRDVLTFAAWHLGTQPDDGQLPDRGALRGAADPQIPAYDPATSQSTVWARRSLPAGTVLGHDGAYRGYVCTLVLVPERATAVVLLTNSATGRRLARSVEHDVVSRVLGAAPPESRTAVAPVDAARFAGTYHYPGTSDLTISPDPQGLAVRGRSLTGQPVDLLLPPISPMTFGSPDWSGRAPELVFLPDIADGAMLMRLDERLGRRVEGTGPR